MNDIDTKEDLWGYGKRLRFVRDSIETAFPGRENSELRILDVGCGSATQLGLPLARLGYQLTGIDTHKPSINMAAELARDYPNATFICGSIEEMNTEPFDIVILSEVLEHVSEPEKLLAESLRHMTNGGLAIVTVPNGYGEFEWDSWLFQSLKLDRLLEKYAARRSAQNGSQHMVSSTENHESGHIQFFTQGRIHKMFKSCGLTITKKNGSTLASGPFAGHTLARFPAFIDWNARVTDKIPIIFSSGWFFALRRNLEADT